MAVGPRWFEVGQKSNDGYTLPRMQEALSWLLVAAVSLLAGAAINALADSLPVTRRAAWPRCTHCGAGRPRVGWISLLGLVGGASNCSYCGEGRGLRPAMVESASVAFGVWLYSRNPDPIVFIPGLVVGLIFLLVAVIDIEHRLILRIVVAPSAIAILLLGMLQPGRGAVKSLLGGLAGFVLLWLMYLLGIAVSRWIGRRRGAALEEVAFGFGDVMLGGLIGLAVGWPGVIIAVVIGILAAGLYSLAYLLVMILRRHYTPYTAIPYGPFLLLGACMVYYGGRTALEQILGAG